MGENVCFLKSNEINSNLFIFSDYFLFLKYLIFFGKNEEKKENIFWAGCMNFERAVLENSVLSPVGIDVSLFLKV